MQTVVHEYKRGTYVTYVKDDGPNFGYSSRVAYAMGLDKPRYPVPTVITEHYIIDSQYHKDRIILWFLDGIFIF